MTRGQGRSFEKEKIAQIQTLLAQTELSIQEISTRMGCSRSAILSINRRFAIRRYESRRTSWKNGSVGTAMAQSGKL